MFKNSNNHAVASVGGCDWCSEKIEGMVFMLKSKHSKYGYHRLCLKCYKERK
jgi:hypothetical protein